jgi:hypothetical protein
MVTAPGALSQLTPQTLALQAVQERLKRGPSPTQDQKDALARLGQVRQAFKAGANEGATPDRLAESRKANAAGAAQYLQNAQAATGEVRGLLKELTTTLRKAGLAPADSSVTEDGAADVPAANPWGDGAKSKALAMTEIRSTAGEIAQTFGKVVKKLRQDLLAAQLRGADPQQVRAVETQLRDGEKELTAAMRGLNGGTGSTGASASKVDLRA